MPIFPSQKSVSHQRHQAVIVYCASAVILGLGFICLNFGLYKQVTEPQNSQGIAVAVLGIGTSLIASAIVMILVESRQLLQTSFLEYGIINVWTDRMGRRPADQQPIDWVSEMDRAKNRCVLMGASLSGYLKFDKQRFERVIGSKVEQFDVELFILNPVSLAAKVRANEEDGLVARIIDALNVFWKIRGQLGDNVRGRFKLYVYDYSPTFSLLWVDEHMIVTHYLPGTPNDCCPAMALSNFFVFPEDKRLYRLFNDNMDFIRKGPGTKLITNDVDFAAIVGGRT